MSARHHHFVSQCYLRSFAVKRKKAYQTTVFDARTRRMYTTSVENIAAERDFNRVDAEGHPPDALETGIATFEADVAPAIERVKAAGNLENENDRALIFNFMCLLSLRNPRQREIVRDFQERVMKQVMALLIATPQRWESHVRKAAAAGYITRNDLSYEQMKKFVNEDQYTLQTSTNYHIKLEIELFDKVLPSFFQRRWMVLSASERSGGFITSDHPVCLMWSDPDRQGVFPPGHRLKGTQIVFPLSPKIALLGAFDALDGTLAISDEHVAAINSAVAAHAEWQVYARDAHFHFVSEHEDGIRKASKLLDDPLFKRPVEEDQPEMEPPDVDEGRLLAIKGPTVAVPQLRSDGRHERK